MKREDKNKQTKRHIMDSALDEFSKQGYGASSINAVCSSQGISKGIIYHYFSTKDDLYLACVEECFLLLTEYLTKRIQTVEDAAGEQLEEYFTARVSFFAEHPVYQRIFCESIIAPPSHLRDEVQKRRESFDVLNVRILKRLLASVSLRPEITITQAIDTFRQFQDFINAKYQVMELSASEFEAHEENCRKILDILLHGVTARKE